MKLQDYKHFRVTKTQASIVNALLILIQKYPLKDLPIATICLEADVGRATFYRNFESKEDVLKMYIKVLNDKYFIAVKETSNLTIEKLAKLFFEYWEENKAFLSLVDRNDISLFLLEESRHVENYIQDSQLNVFPKTTDNFTEIESYYFHSFYFAGFWRLLCLWASRNFQETTDEMISAFLKIHYANKQSN
jgi:AcrR family transcriptional regulator